MVPKMPAMILTSVAAAAIGLVAYLSGPGDLTSRDPADWRVIDGDTVEYLPSGLRIRLENVNAPEIHPCGCPYECRLGFLARAFTTERLRSATTTEVRIYRPRPTDRYGRTIAWLIVDGQDLGQALVDAGLGRAYQGGPRQPWCRAGAHSP